MRRARLMALASLLSGLGCGDAEPPRDASSANPRANAGSASAFPACDAAPLRTWYRDLDGDGFGIPGDGATTDCADRQPEGFADNARDCDDGDPSKQAERFVDADGDGYGSEQTECVAADAAGHAAQSGDCDDADPERSPRAAEDWFDDHDADCDSQDNPQGCIAAPSVPRANYPIQNVRLLPPLDAIPVKRTPDCAGSADLYFAIVGVCPLCVDGSATLVIANAGSVAARFRVTSDLERIEVDGALQPQQVASPIALRVPARSSTITVEALGGVRDCEPDNDRASIEVPRVECGDL